MAEGPLSVERDLLELMVAYGFVPPEAIAGAAPAAPTGEDPAPRRTEGLAVLRLAVLSGAPGAGRTTLVAGLARAWSRAGRSVLIVDLDPADELARVLLLGSAITVNTGQMLLRAVADGGIAEPSHTILPGVDLVAAGGLGGHGEELPALLRARPDGLRDALEPWLDRYDRILVDAPTAPNALRHAACSVADAGLLALPADAVDGDLRLPANLFGVVVTRFDATRPPPSHALARLAGAGLLDTGVPVLPGVTAPWHVVAGTGGRVADAVFTALAAEIDARRGRGGPVPLAEVVEAPTVVDMRGMPVPEPA